MSSIELTANQNKRKPKSVKRPSKSALAMALRSRKFSVSLTILICMIGFVFIYPLINTANPMQIVAPHFEAPSSEHILGTDNFGRDIFLEICYGMRNSLYVGLVGGLTALAIGMLIGLVAGYCGGIVDHILTTVINAFVVIPSFIILILISVSLETRTIASTALIIGITNWPWTARSIRSQTMSLRTRDHVNMAKISGYSTFKIILKEIIPYLASYISMALVLQIAQSILQEASLSMLGLGPHNTISLGTMMNWAIMSEAPLRGAWWAFIPTAIMIAMTTFNLNMMNTGLDEVFNPKIRS